MRGRPVNRGKSMGKRSSQKSTLNVPSVPGDTDCEPGPSLGSIGSSRGREDRSKPAMFRSSVNLSSSRQDLSMRTNLESKSVPMSYGSDDSRARAGTTEADPDRLAVEWLQDRAGERFETSHQVFSRFKKEQNQRNEREKTLCAKVKSLFAVLEGLGGLTADLRAQASEATDYLIAGVKELSDDAMRSQVGEIMRGRQMLVAVAKIRANSAIDASRLRRGSPPPTTTLLGTDLDRNEDSDEKDNSRTGKKGISSRGIASRLGNSDDSSADSDSFQAVRASFGDEISTAASALAYEVAEDSPSSDEYSEDGDDGEGLYDPEDQDDDDDRDEVDLEQDARSGGSKRVRWGRQDDYSDDERRGPAPWAYQDHTPKGKDVATGSDEEEDDGLKEYADSSRDKLADMLAQRERLSWDQLGGNESPASSVESWVAEQAVRLEESDIEVPEDQDIQHGDAPTPPTPGTDREDEAGQVWNGLKITHKPEALPPPPAVRTTKSHSQPQPRNFPSMDVISSDTKWSSHEAEESPMQPRPNDPEKSHLKSTSNEARETHTKSSSSEAEESSGLSTGSEGYGGVTTADASQSTGIEGHTGPRSTMPKPLGNSSWVVKVKRKRLRRARQRRARKVKQCRRKSVPSGRGISSTMERDESQPEKKTSMLDNISKAIGSMSTTADTKACLPPRGLGASISSIAYTLPATPADLREALGALVKAQFTAWVELFWFLVTGSYLGLDYMVRLVVDPVQSVCARFEHWIEHPLPRMAVSRVSWESRIILAIQLWLGASFLVGQIYVALQRERAVWMDANRDTRIYLLEYMREDPSWKWLPGVDPNLMFGWGEVKRIVWSWLYRVSVRGG
ncbi:hypothetical protein ACO1O0_005477 [Amphichorda felina]